MPRRLTTEEFIEKAIKKHKTCKDKDEYDYSLVNYVNGYTEVKIIHKTCGKIFEQKPSNHLDGCGCQYCYGTPKKTTEQFIEDAKKVHGNKFDYSLVDYVDCKTKVKIICNECKRVFEQTPNSHLKGDGCSWCAPNKKLTREEFIEKSKQAHGDRYDYKFVNYINSNTNVKIRCKEHGIFEQTPSNHMGGHGCKYCRMDLLREKFALTTEEFIKRAKQIHGDRYDYSLVNYVNSKTKVKIICPEHGVFEQMPDNHYNGAKCPCCQYFKGEQRIADYLSSKNIENIYEHKYPDLKDKDLLSYDFYIEKYNLLIEFNGRQHYEFVSYFHKDLHDFHRQLHHDWLKRKYAREHNIELLVIPYWDFDNIEKILEQIILEKEIKEVA